MLLFFIFVVGLIAVLGLIRAGGVIFADGTGVDPDGKSVSPTVAPSAQAKRKALIQASLCAIALLGCGLLYEWGYNSSEAKQQRALTQGEAHCSDVLGAYKAAQVLIRQVESASFSFPFVPAPESESLGNCEFKIMGSVERVIDAGVRERADFIVYVRYELEQDAWELLGLEWS